MPGMKRSLVVLLASLLCACAPIENPVVRTWTQHECFTHDARGFKINLPNAAACHRRMTLDGKPIADVVSTTDAFGRRTTVPKKSAKKGFVAFLGCSFTYGQSVADPDTYPSRVARLLPGWTSFNYGVPGYGPGDVLHLMQAKNLKQELPAGPGKFVYLWMEDHPWRTVGTLSRPFTDESPSYDVDKNGQAILHGNLREAHPIRYFLFDLLRPLHLQRWFRFEIPPRLTESDFERVGAIFKTLAKVTRERFPESELVIAMDPYPHTDSRAAEYFERFLAGPGIRVVRLSDRVARGKPLADGHPSPEMNQVLAEELVEKLGLGSYALHRKP